MAAPTPLIPRASHLLLALLLLLLERSVHGAVASFKDAEGERPSNEVLEKRDGSSVASAASAVSVASALLAVVLTVVTAVCFFLPMVSGSDLMIRVTIHLSGCGSQGGLPSPFVRQGYLVLAMEERVGEVTAQ